MNQIIITHDYSKTLLRQEISNNDGMIGSADPKFCLARRGAFFEFCLLNSLSSHFALHTDGHARQINRTGLIGQMTHDETVSRRE